jgi:hypothetical protein
VIIKHYPFMNIDGCHVMFLFIFDTVKLRLVDLV